MDLDIEETQGHALNFPLLADPYARMAKLYEMIHQSTGRPEMCGAAIRKGGMS